MNRETLTIRPMTPEDFPALAAWMVTIPLWQRYGLAADRVTAQFQAAQTRGEILLSADHEAADIPIGFAWCIPTGAFGRSAYLRLIGVHPDYAGDGVGARLLARVEAAAGTTSDSLFLLVSDFNQDAQRFYRKHGYQQAGSLADYVLPGVAELIFWKRLRP
ncbi:MAG: GNAT family N-acetyltransferase [Anaerolineaceae bacterium]|nr:GNAT family N-acetyltransferase [Anaerolineaceae bacterium]